MGLWDKVKSVKNMVTGGGAEVSVIFEHERQTLGEPFRVLIRAEIKDADIEIEKVYLNVRAAEHIEADGIEIEYEGGEQEIEREIVRKQTETFRLQVEVAEAQTLSANESYEWQAEILIPEELNGTYEGKFAWHVYELFAGLDAPGNDPDSGWIPFEIY